MQTQKIYTSFDEVIATVLEKYQDVNSFSIDQRNGNFCKYSHEYNGVGCFFSCLFTEDFVREHLVEDKTANVFLDVKDLEYYSQEIVDCFDYEYDVIEFMSLQTIHDYNSTNNNMEDAIDDLNYLRNFLKEGGKVDEFYKNFRV